MHMQWGKLHAKSRVCHISKEEIKINQILGVSYGFLRHNGQHAPGL